MAIEYVEDLLYQALAGDAALTAVVGSRIFPMFEQEAVASPYLTYALTDEFQEEERHFGGPGKRRSTFQVDVWSASSSPHSGYRDVVRGSWAVRTLLDNKPLKASEGPIALTCKFVAWRDLPTEEEPRIRRRQSDYEMLLR